MAGQPPRHVMKTRCSISTSDTASIFSCGLSNNSFKLMAPFDSCDSHKLIGSISICEILPLPEWRILDLSTVFEPVSMNCPSIPRSSTVVRTASQRIGISCHSSINRGVLPLNKREGFASAAAKYCARILVSCNFISLAAACSAVVVFPHHFGPSIKTAPKAFKRSCNWTSAMRR